MGADIFLENQYNQLQERFRPSFEAAVNKRDGAKSKKQRDLAQAEVGRILDETHSPTVYFRDPYNSNCLLAQLGLSWWNDISPLCDQNDKLPLSKVRWLLDEVRTRLLTCQVEATHEQIVAAEVMTKVSGGQKTVQPELKEEYSSEDVEWFVRRKAALITFLQTAIELREEPVCSL